jgi:hypothetical protein
MNLDDLIDFANQVNQDISRYWRPFILNPSRLLADDFVVHQLDWQAIRYGRAEIDKVPDDKRGVYAFAVRIESTVLPPHGYILYMGIAGDDSDRPLRERYQEYLNANKVKSRAGIARMIGDWHEVLQFIFAPVDDSMSTTDLRRLETQLNTALIPPYSEQDIDADVRARRRAFR